MGVGLLFFGLISAVRYFGMHDTVYDLTIFYQAVSHYSHFQVPASYARGMGNLLGDHFHPILMILAPLLWIWNNPFMLVIAQVLLLVAAVPAIYLFARARLGSHRLALILAAAGLFSPGFLLMAQFDFHELAFAIPLFAWAIYAMEKEKWTILITLLIGLMFTKENLYLLVAAFGVVLFIRRKYILGLSAVIAGTGGFMFITKVVMPYLAHSKSYSYWTYTEVGANPIDAAKNILFHPLHVLKVAITPFHKAVLLLKTFVPMMGLSFITPLAILLLPQIGERVLSSNPNYWDFGYQYQALLGLTALICAIDGLKRICDWISNQNIRRFFIKTAVCTIMLATIMMTAYVLRFTYIGGGYTLDFKAYQQIRQVENIIPEGARVCADNNLGAYIIREKVAAIEYVKSLSTCDLLIYNPVPIPKVTQEPSFEGDFQQVLSLDGVVVYKRVQ